MSPRITALALLLLVGCAERTVRPGGNLLIVLLDDIGIDQVGAYQAHPDPPITPVMDGLAAEGMRFENAWGMPSCSPARAALLTGRTARHNGVGSNVKVDDPPNQRLRLREQTVAELLRRRARYRTALIGKWHLVSRQSVGYRRHPNRQGFDRFRGTLGPPNAARGMKGDYWRWSQIADGKRSVAEGYEPLHALEEAGAAVTELEPPWLVVASFNLAHSPLHAPPADLVHTPATEASSPSEKYRAMVEAADTLIGQLLERVPEDVRADTTVIVVGDNGTPDHGIRAPLDPAEAKTTFHEGGVRVPLIVAGPLVAEPGSVSPALVSVVDLLPTAAEIAGVRSRRALDGVSLLPLLADPDGPGGHELLYAEDFAANNREPDRWIRSKRAIRDQRWKWIELPNGRSQFYRLDPTGLGQEGPLHDGDLTEEEREIRDRLWRELEARRE